MAYQSLLKSWGDPGVEWNTGWAFKKDEPLPAEWGNYLIDNLITDVQHLIDLTNTIDPDNDGTVVNADQVDGLDASQLGGFNYVTTSQPTASTVAETWFHPDSNLLQIWDGGNWKAQPTVRKYSNFPAPRDEYYTSHESPYPHTQQYDGKIELIEEIAFADFEESFNPLAESRGTADVDFWNPWAGDTSNFTRDRSGAITGDFSGKLLSENDRLSVSTTHEYGIEQYFEFDTKIELDTLSINDTVEYVVTNGSGTEIARIIFHDGAGNVEVVGANRTEILGSWSPGSVYTFLLEWDFANDQFDLAVNGGTSTTHAMKNTSSSFAKFEAINDTVSSADTRSIWIDGLTQGPHMSGSALVQIDRPEFISMWSSFDFTEALNGGNVVVDVENSADDSVLVSDYVATEDISQDVVPSVTPQLRVNLSRNSYTDTPTFTDFDVWWTLEAEDTGKWVSASADRAKNSAYVANVLL